VIIQVSLIDLLGRRLPIHGLRLRIRVCRVHGLAWRRRIHGLPLRRCVSRLLHVHGRWRRLRDRLRDRHLLDNLGLRRRHRRRCDDRGCVDCLVPLAAANTAQDD